jgi:flavodoxin
MTDKQARGIRYGDVNYMKEIKTVHLVYFSGTGGTARVAWSFEKVFADRKIDVCKTELSIPDYIEKNADMLVLFFPVHAFNAPKPVDEWIARSPEVNGRPAAVISVSGGGEARPNIACRADVIKQLEAKGYDVFYESMIVMPTNVFKPYDDTLSAMLLRVLPHKSEMIVSDMLSGNRNRT